MRKKVPIALKFDADLLERLDRDLAQMSPPVTRTAVIETAVREWLDRRGAAKRQAKTAQAA